MGAETVHLLHGLWRAGACRRHAVLQPPGWQAILDLAGADGLSAASWTTQALAAAIPPTEGGDAAPDPGGWTAGDRALAMLALQRMLAGGRTSVVAECPACGTAMEAGVGAGDIPLPDPLPAAAPWHEATVEGVRVRFRLPTGDDLEALGREAGGAAALVGRMVLEQDGPVSAAALEEELSGQVARLDPFAELLLGMACPACGHRTDALLDPAAHLHAAIRERAARLAWEVHGLARHYGWSEQEILALPEERRARYLALVGEAP